MNPTEITEDGIERHSKRPAGIAVVFLFVLTSFLGAICKYEQGEVGTELSTKAVLNSNGTYSNSSVAKSETSTNGRKISNYSIIEELFILSGTLFLVAFLYYLIIRYIESKRLTSVGSEKILANIQMIAWDGFNERDFKECLKGCGCGQIDVLEYVRGINKVTHLRYNESKFDILISDSEFLNKQYSSAKNLENCSPDKGGTYETIWNKINSSINRKVEENIKLNSSPNKAILGIPVRMGIHDILVDKKALEDFIPNKKSNYGYDDFNLTEMVKYVKAQNNFERHKIGLWNWHVPTIPILLKLFMENTSLRKVIFKKFNDEKFWNDNKGVIETNIRNIVKLIRANRDCFCIVNDPKEVKKWFSADVADGVNKAHNLLFLLGGGSFLLGQKQEPDRISSIVPNNDELLMFVECISILSKRDNLDEAALLKLIGYFFDVETQLKVCNREAYLTLPVTNVAINEIMTNKNQEKTFKVLVQFIKSLNVYDEIPNPSASDERYKLLDRIIPRRLPPDHISMMLEGYWNEIEGILS